MDSANDSGATRPTGRVLAWMLIAMAVVTPAIVAYATGAAPYEMGRRAGAGLLITILAVYAAHRFSRRESARYKTIALWCAVLLAVAVAGVASYRAVQAGGIDAEVNAARVEAERMNAAVGRIALWIAGHPGVRIQEHPEFAAVAPTGIDLADQRVPLRNRAVEFKRRRAVEQLEAAAALQAALADGGIMDPNAFALAVADPSQRQPALSALAAARTAVATFLPATEQSLARGLAQIDSLGMPDESREEMRGGLRQSVEESMPALRAHMGQLDEALAELEALARFIQETPGARALDGVVVFAKAEANQAYAERFGDLLAKTD